MASMGRLGGAVTGLVLALGVVGASAETVPPSPATAEVPVPATAEGPHRDEYVSNLEKVCKPGAEETQRAMKGVRDDVKEDRIPVATHKFENAPRRSSGERSRRSPTIPARAPTSGG
jgi:hypothetical protein